MENQVEPRSQKEIERDQIKIDIGNYTAGLELALRLRGTPSESIQEEIYAKANAAGDRIFGQERERAGVRTGDFEGNALEKFGRSITALKEGVEEYRNNMTRLRTEKFLDADTEDKLRERTIDLQKKLIGEGVGRIIF